MNKITFSILVIFYFNQSYCQEGPTPIESGELVITSLRSGDLLRLELAHPNHFYQDSDTINVFGPGGKVGYIDFECFGNSCNPHTVEDLLSYPSGKLGIANVIRHPLGIELIATPQKGIYEISVIRNAKVHHKRTFKIVDPEPVITFMELTDFEGNSSSDALKIDKTHSLNQVKLKFVGQHLDVSFESVTIQGLPLKKHNTESGTFILSESWTPQAIAKLSLGETEVVFKRKFSDKVTKQKITLEADKPVINEPGLNFQADINENKTKMTLSVQHLFPGAKLILQNDDNFPNFLESSGRLEAKNIDAFAGTISTDILFKSSMLVDNAKFKAQVLNRDGKISDPKTIIITRKEENIRASAYDNDAPLVSGIRNRVMFKQLGGSPFDLNAGLNFSLAINGFEPIKILGRKETDQSFSAEVKFPNGLPDNIKFTLTKERANWSGSFKNILSRPIVTIRTNRVYRGSKIKVNIQNAKDVRILSRVANDLITITETTNGTDKSFDIGVAKEIRLSQFGIQILLKDHILEEHAISISNWPKPLEDNLRLTIEEGEPLEKKDIVVLNDRRDIKLSFNADSLKYIQHFSARLIKTDGTRLGIAKPLILNEQTNKIETTLSPRQVGLQKGEAFNIEISNPTGESLLKPSYIKRSGRDQWIFTAGISVLDVPFDNNDEGDSGSNVSVFQGINLAGYYMFENIKNPQNRFLGIGPNVLFSEEDGEIKLRGAISLLFFEKLVMGISFDKNDLGLLVGANIELANLTSLIRNE